MGVNQYALGQSEGEALSCLPKLKDSFANLRAGHAVRRAAAAADTVLTSRADYFENYSGRFISIEARTSDNSSVTSQNPIMTAAWNSGAGRPVGVSFLTIRMRETPALRSGE